MTQIQTSCLSPLNINSAGVVDIDVGIDENAMLHPLLLKLNKVANNIANKNKNVHPLQNQLK